jgi:hypothetical protein
MCEALGLIPSTADRERERERERESDLDGIKIHLRILTEFPKFAYYKYITKKFRCHKQYTKYFC